jgi:uncharacterized protein YdaU (DUF1376 family)
MKPQNKLKHSPSTQKKKKKNAEKKKRRAHGNTSTQVLFECGKERANWDFSPNHLQEKPCTLVFLS